MTDQILSSLAAGGPMAILLGAALWWQVKENKKLRLLYEGDPGDEKTKPTIGRLEQLRREYEGDPDDLENKPGKIAAIRTKYETELANEREENKALYREITQALKEANAASNGDDEEA